MLRSRGFYEDEVQLATWFKSKLLTDACLLQTAPAGMRLVHTRPDRGASFGRRILSGLQIEWLQINSRDTIEN